MAARTAHQRWAGDGSDLAAHYVCLDALRQLPQPLHAMEYALRAQHYHFGLFEHAGDDVAAAQERLAEYAARRIDGARAVLDVGCGLGGTSRVLARAGVEVTAIDRCRASIAYATAAAARRPSPGRIRFAADTVEALATRAPRAFDAVVAIEVLQYFPVLDALFDVCARLLLPGGTLVVLDVSVDAEVPWSRVPFHRVGALCRQAAGRFSVVEHADLTRSVRATPAALARTLAASRAGLLAFFAAGGRTGRRPVAAEFDELLGHVRDL